MVQELCVISDFLVGKKSMMTQASPKMTVTANPASNPKVPPWISFAHVPVSGMDTRGEGEPVMPLTGMPKKFP